MSQGSFPIVGVGASAGGLEALEGLFQGIPDDPGIGFVIVTHLNPERESLLHEIIARYTKLKVEVASDGELVQPNHVYVLPADAILGIENGALKIRKLEASRRERKPIDIFLSALAKDRGEYAASIVLSGGDGDGTLGTKAIKERGGLTMAQVANGHGPAHSGMPDSAISTGFVDFAIPVDQMGTKLIEYCRGLRLLDGGVDPSRRADSDSKWREAREEIYKLLRNQAGHDFAGYKTKTFIRRVQRRMLVLRLDDVEAYIEVLRQDPKEIEALFRDLLINVTNFFRDTDAFDTLGRLVIPKLLEGRGANDVIRIWVPGCSTGEEAYSIAILMREHMQTMNALPQVQIFATDIDEHALTVARSGRYPAALLDGVSPERKKRFFIADAGGYVVSKDIRDCCIFSSHSVIKDPPFSRIDLVSCRNLLIYFASEVQRHVIPIFHYSLRPRGFLFLGISENIGQFSDLFIPLEKKERLFRRVDVSAVTPRLPHAVTALRMAPSGNRVQSPPRTATGWIALRQAIETQVLEGFAPPFVVVDREGDVIYYSARTGKYLEPGAGAPTRQLLHLARKGLRLELRTALREAVEFHQRIERQGISVAGDDGRVQILNLTVEPIAELSEGEPLYLVLFDDEGPTLSHEESLNRIQWNPEATDAAHLNRELRETRERLQALVEEYETALEELKSSNEELVSVNEEMQSTNEELEASKEEMQSLNEELNTVNAELLGKIEALDAANSDLQNLFDSTQVAIVFLDKNLIIRSFTPAVTRMFRILGTDIGRPITDLATQVPLPTFTEDVKAVLSGGKILERRIDQDANASSFLVRFVPYRDVHQRTDGVVVTFVDVTTLAKAEQHQRTLIAELNHRVKNMLTVIISLAAQTRRAAASPEEYESALIGRLHAMARSYALLSRENWTDASIEELVQLTLAPFGLERVVAKGPVIKLHPQQTLSVGMVLHELATNAGKYGALSNPAGHLSVDWSLTQPNEKGMVEISWREEGGPKTAHEPRIGFGLKLVARETEYNLRGKALIEFSASGLQATVRFPLSEEHA